MSLAYRHNKLAKPAAQWLTLGAILLGIGAALPLLLYQDYIQVDSIERERLANQVRIVDENLGHRIEAIYKTMAEIRKDGDLLTSASGRIAYAHVLQTLDDAMLDVRTLTILDSQGIVLTSNREQLIGRDFSDREYFRTARQGGDPDMLYVSPPFTTALRAFAINMTRVRLDAEGGFAGIVAVTLDPKYFSILLDSVRYRSDTWSALSHGDGKQFMMVPDREGMAGLDLAKPDSFFSRHMESARAANVITGVVFATGEERMMALRTISPAAAHMDKPLVVAISRDQSAIFADWRLNVYRLGGLFAILFLSATLGMFFYQRRQRAHACLVASYEAERLQTEEQIHKLAQAVEQSPESIVITNLAAEIEYVNQAFMQTTGYSSEEVIGRNPRFLQSGKTPPETYTSLWQALTQGQTWQGEFQNQRKDGSVYIESARISLVRQHDGRVSHYLAVKQDITDRIHKEQEQQALERQLLQAQKMELIGHLTGGIAHDFNNILASMLGFVEILQMTPEINQNQKSNQYLNEILQGGIRAKELVAQLISFSHRREAATKTILVAPIVNEVAKLLRATLPTTISIDVAIAEGLPEVLISPVQLHQILMNLGVNARDAITDQGAIEIKVEPGVLTDFAICHSCRKDFSGNYVMISVHDSGVGIPAGNLAKIFDPFFTTKEVGHGSGLGLSVLHGIVHSANGHIAVQTAPGEGTEFRIFLPVQSHQTEHLVLDAHLTGNNAAIRGHVLVVDDEASIVGFLAVQLESLGCKVTGLTSSAEALRLFEDDPYGVDLVITDQSMPEMTGAELARAMLARRPDLPIVLNTGYSNAVDEATAYRIGIRRFLIKPVPAKVFADVVSEYLGGKKAGGSP